MRNVECILKMLVKSIQEAVTKAPEEEEDSDESNWHDGLSQRKLSCFGYPSVISFERTPLEEPLFSHVSVMEPSSRIEPKP